MNQFRQFILDHENDDLAALVLARGRYPGIDVAAAADAIASRRKLKGKVPEWYANPELVCPLPLSAEQCSSTATARYKAVLAARYGKDLRVADLTGGLGVDSWQFSMVASKVLYNEMNPVLAGAAAENFATLGLNNITVSNMEVTPENIAAVLSGFAGEGPLLVFMDPARRGEGGRKVFRLEDCTPDVLTLQDAVLGAGAVLLLKLSPMADISLVTRQLHCVKEVHVLGAGGECKELLVLCEPGFEGEYSVTVADRDARSMPGMTEGMTEGMTFCYTEERAALAEFGTPVAGQFLFEPGAALMKAGCFSLLCERFGLKVLGRDAHYYLADSPLAELSPLGKWFRIGEVLPFGSGAVKALGKRFSAASLTARGLPLTTEQLRRKAGIAEGGTAHIFALGGGAKGKYIIVCTPILHI